MCLQWNPSKADTIAGPTKIVHYREGVLWSGVYYTLCGLWDSVGVHYRVSSMRGSTVLTLKFEKLEIFVIETYNDHTLVHDGY